MESVFWWDERLGSSGEVSEAGSDSPTNTRRSSKAFHWTTNWNIDSTVIDGGYITIDRKSVV